MHRRAFLTVGAGAIAACVSRTRLQAADDAAPGQHALKVGEPARDGLYYVPRGYKADVPAPLWLVLHGAGGSSQSAAYTFPLADEFGVIILAPDSRDDRTWDGVLLNWGPDVEFIAASVGRVAGICNVDRTRMSVAGFSDGASYALGFGISFGDQFTRIIAMSPGVMQPMARRGTPKIFISHGISDGVMPIDDTSRKFVPRLKALGYDVTYHEYEGRHTVSAQIVREAFEWTFGGKRAIAD
jgi:phospholipase/carboxylesterase